MLSALTSGMTSALITEVAGIPESGQGALGAAAARPGSMGPSAIPGRCSSGASFRTSWQSQLAEWAPQEERAGGQPQPAREPGKTLSIEDDNPAEEQASRSAAANRQFLSQGFGPEFEPQQIRRQRMAAENDVSQAQNSAEFKTALSGVERSRLNQLAQNSTEAVAGSSASRRRTPAAGGPRGPAAQEKAASSPAFTAVVPAPLAAFDVGHPAQESSRLADHGGGSLATFSLATLPIAALSMSELKSRTGAYELRGYDSLNESSASPANGDRLPLPIPETASNQMAVSVPAGSASLQSSPVPSGIPASRLGDANSLNQFRSHGQEIAPAEPIQFQAAAEHTSLPASPSFAQQPETAPAGAADTQANAQQLPPAAEGNIIHAQQLETAAVRQASDEAQQQAKTSMVNAVDPRGDAVHFAAAELKPLSPAGETKSNLARLSSSSPASVSTHRSAAAVAGNVPHAAGQLTPAGISEDPARLSGFAASKRADAASTNSADAAPDTVRPAAHEAFRTLDSVVDTSDATWVHTSARRAEAGFQDPSLGWIGIRAELNGGSVHATVAGSSPEAVQTLSGHLAGLNAYLAENRTPVESLTIGSSGGEGQPAFAAGGQEGNRGGSEHGQSDPAGGSETRGGETAGSSGSDAQISGAKIRGTVVNSLYLGAYISVIA